MAEMENQAGSKQKQNPHIAFSETDISCAIFSPKLKAKTTTNYREQKEAESLSLYLSVPILVHFFSHRYEKKYRKHNKMCDSSIISTVKRMV